MKKMIVLLVLCAQIVVAQNKIFVQVYNLDGKLIKSGKVVSVNDTVLVIKKSAKNVELNVQNIGVIKAKKSKGNNVTKGAAIGAFLGAGFGLAVSNPDSWVFGFSKGEGALLFGAVGAVSGAGIGGITMAFKKTETYTINGDLKNWQVFKETIEKQILK